MTIVPVQGTSLTYHLICYDGEGREIREPGGLASAAAVASLATDDVTDVFLASHGWQGDVPAALSQYQSWFSAMVAAQPSLDDFRPLVVGLHWPSRAWGDEALPAPVAFGAGESSDDGGGGVDEAVERLVDEYAACLGNGVDADLRVILASAVDDPEPDSLSSEVLAAYARLQAALGLRGGGFDGAPGEDGAAFDAEEVYQFSAAEEDFADFAAFRLGSVLAPLRTITFWTMKRRARSFGETGVRALLDALRGAAGERTVRFHLMGHSFGCLVVTAGVCGPAGGPPPAPVSSLSLVQGAMSVWSFASAVPHAWANPGYFRRLVSDRLVEGSVVTTQSRYDRAVGKFYPLGAGIAGQVDYAGLEAATYGGLGTFGIQGPGLEVVSCDIQPTTGSYELTRGGLYNVECSSVISVGGGPSGAHSDIAHPEVAHLVWSAVAAGR